MGFTNLIDKETKLSIGRSLWEERRKRKLSLLDVSRATSVRMVRIDKMETGRSFSFEVCRILVKYYGKNIKFYIE